MFTPDAMRARFREIEAAEAEIRAAAKPFRDEQDRLAAIEGELRDKVRANGAKIREAEAGLFDLMQEKAMLARALGPRGLVAPEPTESVTPRAS